MVSAPLFFVLTNDISIELLSDRDRRVAKMRSAPPTAGFATLACGNMSSID